MWNVDELHSIQTAANAGEKKGWLTGLEPATPRITSSSPVVLSARGKALTASPQSRCTGRCTQVTRSPEELAVIVTLISKLPGTDQQRAEVLAKTIQMLGR